ncbi:MAG: hypothetical protein ACE3JN_16670 [Ectobacillus sp.]
MLHQQEVSPANDYEANLYNIYTYWKPSMLLDGFLSLYNESANILQK